MFLQLIEPLIMIIEMIQVIRFILSLGEHFRNKIFDEDESDANVFKTIVLMITIFNFSLSCYLIYYICKNESFLFAV